MQRSPKLLMDDTNGQKENEKILKCQQYGNDNVRRHFFKFMTSSRQIIVYALNILIAGITHSIKKGKTSDDS